MGDHNLIFIGLLSTLCFFNKSRYAAIFYLIAFAIYVNFYWVIPKQYYYLLSATTDTFVFIFLFNERKFKKITKLLKTEPYKINKPVALLSAPLVLLNFIAYHYHVNEVFPEFYKPIYIMIVSVQIALLFLGIIINAYIDRRIGGSPVVWVADRNNNN